MLRKLVPIVVAAVVAVGLLVAAAFADTTIFLPLVAKAGGVLGEMVRVEDNVIASSDGRYIASRGPLDNLYITDTAAELVWFAEGWGGFTEDYRPGPIKWPSSENMEWVGKILYMRDSTDGTLGVYNAETRDFQYLMIPIPPRPTPTPVHN